MNSINNIKVYQLSYKCRLCGEIILGEAVEISREGAKVLIDKTIAMDQYMNGLTGSRKMHVTHNCINGSVGIADFQGMKVV